MNNRSSRNLVYSLSTFVLLAILWSLLSHFFTSLKITQQLPGLLLTTTLSWLFILAKLRKNEITVSSTQELILYMISFPIISLLVIGLVKVFGSPLRVHYSAYILGSIIIANLTWLLLRLNDKMELTFGRRIKVHSKLGTAQLDMIRQSLVNTPLENHIDLSDDHTLLENPMAFDLLIVANTSDIDEEIISAHMAGVKIESFDNFMISLHGKIPTESFKVSGDYLSLKRMSPMVMFYQRVKNIIEPMIGFFIALALLPLMAVIAILVRLTSKGPAVFKQTRTGYNGQTFTVYKFRSMGTDAEVNGPKWSSNADSRVTPIGRILRASHLDELPQILNVIRGDMGFIGPRPELPEFYQILKKDIPYFHLRTLVKPGITGWAQVKGGYANSVESSRNKLELDLYYILNISLLLDLQIVIDTLTGNRVREPKAQESKSYESTMVAHSKK